MKLFPKPRETEDIYTSEAMAEIASDLGILNAVDIKNFKECLEHAAIDFINSKSSNNTRYTEANENKKLKQLAKSLKKSQKLYLEITNGPQIDLPPIVVPIVELVSGHGLGFPFKKGWSVA